MKGNRTVRVFTIGFQREGRLQCLGLYEGFVSEGMLPCYCHYGSLLFGSLRGPPTRRDATL